MNFKKMYIVLSIMLLLGQHLYAEESSFFSQRDKQKHFAATTLISAGVTGYARNKGYSKVESFFWGFGAAVAVGLLKEGLDGISENAQQSSDDIKADVLGGITGALISTQFEWKF